MGIRLGNWENHGNIYIYISLSLNSNIIILPMGIILGVGQLFDRNDIGAYDFMGI